MAKEKRAFGFVDFDAVDLDKARGDFDWSKVNWDNPRESARKIAENFTLDELYDLGSTGRAVEGGGNLIRKLSQLKYQSTPTTMEEGKQLLHSAKAGGEISEEALKRRLVIDHALRLRLKSIDRHITARMAGKHPEEALEELKKCEERIRASRKRPAIEDLMKWDVLRGAFHRSLEHYSPRIPEGERKRVLEKRLEQVSGMHESMKRTHPGDPVLGTLRDIRSRLRGRLGGRR